ncbi:ATP-dependent RNA helicase DEAH12, chloroplastic-like [Impatiens glandulifera]|uniref:ATP-dependent RNA helicase DEAH12, chloroplastic-like n=1 Tax=Impatiens glandulifera TaxID=253017 RepID=UPI001FB148DC|nr:ATP-dependent RNA helicase DEAH12, chloroplastic-like [Impatiens glandulifera]
MFGGQSSRNAVRRDVLSAEDVKLRMDEFLEEWLKNSSDHLSSLLIEKRILEFKSSMECFIHHLDGRRSSHDSVFKFTRNFNAKRFRFLIRRECRRLEDGLPLYAFRGEILRHLKSHKVMVLIGETGSGKSTQLVQYLADSAIGSIVCSQLRRIAAVSLAKRVKEETYGCYENSSSSIVSCLAYSSDHEISNSKVIYMTDHCLLQHYLEDNSLSGISCIIIDEAHERSLNTDLLLAMVKSLISRRQDLTLIVMSATADAKKLAKYFGCGTFDVIGRNFPVDIEYVPGVSSANKLDVSDVLKAVSEIHRTEADGAILVFLTSQTEVEWASETFQAPNTVTLPLHGKLSFEDQHRIFLDYPQGKRKVIFSTNVAETSLTIPGVKYVVDSGMMKLRRFEHGTCMNVLKVCSISQSSAEQRAGRAGRTAPGKCYRLYSKDDFEQMPPHQEPEICRVHLGIVVLRIIAMGVKDVLSFDFIDAPNADAIDKAIQNLIQLGAVVSIEEGLLELTGEGKKLVRLGIEPRLGKLILECFYNNLGKEGLVLAAVTANASSIFCRYGNEENKHKSDRYKVKFCHRDGDLFTMLAVYKEWKAVPLERRSKWCWENSINAKSMRRCDDMILELEICLRKEFGFIIPNYWCWNPHVPSEDVDKYLKKAILSSLAENVAMYSGHDRLGYEVALTGRHVQLHPTSSLLVFSQKPSWIVFVEILSSASTHQFLVCATAVDYEDFSTISHPFLFDASTMQHHKLQQAVLNGYGSTSLRRLCGKFTSYLVYIVSSVRKTFMDERIGIEVKVDQNAIHIYAPSQHMENVCNKVNTLLGYERKWLQNECFVKFLYPKGSNLKAMPPFALFGSGADIKHLELERKTLSVDVFCSDANVGNNNKKLLMFLEDNTPISSGICSVQRDNIASTSAQEDKRTRWGKITFLTHDAVEEAVVLSPVTLDGAVFEIVPSMSGSAAMYSFPAIRVTLNFPRRRSQGFAVVKCDPGDVLPFVDVVRKSLFYGRTIYCEPSIKSNDGVVIKGLDLGLSEEDILDGLRMMTDIRILNLILLREKAEDKLKWVDCEDALCKEFTKLIPRRTHVLVQVSEPHSADAFMKAVVTFDGSLHLEAATALEQIEGKVLPGCLPWQKIKCHQWFNSSLSCNILIYRSIQKQLTSVLESFHHKRGVYCSGKRNDNGSYKVNISANATRKVAELRRPLEELMRGRMVVHDSLTPAVVQLLYSREGVVCLNSIMDQTGTYILFDKNRQCILIFGGSSKVQVDDAEQKIIGSLLEMYSGKELEIHLRGAELPPDLMKQVVKKFGPDLIGLKEKIPEAEGFTLNARLHIISVHGNKEQKERAEMIIHEIIAQTAGLDEQEEEVVGCPICLCKVEDTDAYKLEDCGHLFCRTCLVEQCSSAIRNRGESFPVRCMFAGCKSRFLLTDLRALLTTHDHPHQLDELFRASMATHVAASGGKLRFCPSPDCPSVYRAAAEEDEDEAVYVCGACYWETCRRCHLEYHPSISCKDYREYKEDPDSSLREWTKGKENVQNCPNCNYTIEKTDGCNHMQCVCGAHVCWVCLELFESSDECYSHLRSIHLSII